MELSRYSRAIALLAALAFAPMASAAPLAFALEPPTDGSCLRDPVVDAQWDELRIEGETVFLGEWILPASSDRPDLPSEVILRAWIEPREGRAHELVLEFRYGGDHPLGIFYGLQKVELSVLTRQGRLATSLDWTDGCNVGNIPSLLPGDHHTVTIDVPGPVGKETLFFPQLRFWGSLN